MESKGQNPFSTLQKNASDLFDRIYSRNSSKMLCRDGCSLCCEAEFSVHLGEALLIYDWFMALSAEDRGALQRKWLIRDGMKKIQCQFLRDGSCTIYDARPIICRTQGAPLCISDEVKKTKSLNCCPLNFNQGSEIPETNEDWFELNRLTELQSIAEHFIRKNREIPAEISAILDKDQRVPLKKIQEILANFR